MTAEKKKKQTIILESSSTLTDGVNEMASNKKKNQHFVEIEFK